MIALCHGTFDFLHVGHVLMFAEARTLCDELIVTLTADIYVNKGPGRPVFNEWERLQMVRACRYVTHAEIIYEASGAAAIDKFKPSIYVKGADYLVMDKHGALGLETDLVERHGGRLYIAKHAGWSSSKLIARLKDDEIR